MISKGTLICPGSCPRIAGITVSAILGAGNALGNIQFIVKVSNWGSIALYLGCPATMLMTEPRPPPQTGEQSAGHLLRSCT